MSDNFDENKDGQDAVSDILDRIDEQSNQIMNELDGGTDYDIQPEESAEEVADEIPDTVEYAEEQAEYTAVPEKPKRAVKKSKKKKKKKRKRSRLPGVLILVTLIFGVSIISSLVIIGYGKDMLGIGKSEETHLLVVPEGATTEEIAIMLKDDGIIKSSEAFKLFVDLRNKEQGYISGEHFIRPNMPYETLVNELTQLPTEELGDSIEVTFPEGVTLIEASNILEENGICDAEDFVFYFNSGGFGLDFEDLLPVDTSLKFERMEGYLFPDTYFFYENSDVETVCQKIYYNFESKMTDERLAKMRKLNLSLDQLVTFASIVQKEAATTADMSDVASVFWNRLNNNDDFPLLQSDPTSNYANDVVRPNIEYYNETIINAYDTYKSPGLPPGAICNPGIEAIDAVLEAKQTSYFYFIANINTKVTYFSETLEQHEEYQALIEQQYAEEALNGEE
ncbi:MAG: endolytic transglycosylase MltG [Ruminococcus flavefaciens]|nr:endolytic transglycosylase MltG [Ruminococcus flavefaciens]MCM1229891.1 endolytic transglycosylase MltG [Ruminococcus flavefaciens]